MEKLDRYPAALVPIPELSRETIRAVSGESRQRADIREKLTAACPLLTDLFFGTAGTSATQTDAMPLISPGHELAGLQFQRTARSGA
jgi:hypothetical protein